MKRIEIRSRRDNACLWSGDVEDDDASPVRTALERAVKDGANLEGANLDETKYREDVHAVLDAAPHEAAELLAALHEGRINGTAYEGECACLVGTIANARGCHYQHLEGLAPNASRPAERWFYWIHEGHTPANSTPARLAAEWIEEWLKDRTWGEWR